MRLLRRDAFMTAVKTSELRNPDDPSGAGHLTWNRALLAERQVRPGSMVIIEVPRQRPPRVPRAENHEMIQTFPPNGPDQALGIRILPRALGSCEHLFDT